MAAGRPGQLGPTQRYDLVSAQYAHLPNPERDSLFVRLAAAGASGGTLLIVGRHPSYQPESDRYFTAEDLTAILDPAAWVVLATTVERPRTGPMLTHDALLNVRRR